MSDFLRRFRRSLEGRARAGWKPALLSTPDEWQHYLRERVRQRFTAIQWVATQWRASPSGDRLNELAFTGTERIAVNPAFFQRLDEKVTALNDAGLLSVPVLLFAMAPPEATIVPPTLSVQSTLFSLVAEPLTGNDVPVSHISPVAGPASAVGGL